MTQPGIQWKSEWTVILAALLLAGVLLSLLSFMRVAESPQGDELKTSGFLPLIKQNYCAPYQDLPASLHSCEDALDAVRAQYYSRVEGITLVTGNAAEGFSPVALADIPSSSHLHWLVAVDLGEVHHNPVSNLTTRKGLVVLDAETLSLTFRRP